MCHFNSNRTLKVLRTGSSEGVAFFLVCLVSYQVIEGVQVEYINQNLDNMWILESIVCARIRVTQQWSLLVQQFLFLEHGEYNRICLI